MTSTGTWWGRPVLRPRTVRTWRYGAPLPSRVIRRNGELATRLPTPKRYFFAIEESPQSGGAAVVRRTISSSGSFSTTVSAESAPSVMSSSSCAPRAPLYLKG